MSHEDDKKRHSRRLHQDQVAIDKQLQIAKDYGMHRDKWRYIEQPHRNHKKHILNCGNPRCYMCANPRKVSKEKTIQEQRFEQREKQHGE